MLKNSFLYLFKLSLFVLIMFNFVSCTNTSTQFLTVDDQQLDLSQEHGKWLVVNYWTTWCNSCIKNIGVLDQLKKRLKNKNVQVVSINYDFPSKKQLKKLVKHFHIEYPVLLRDPAEQLNLGHVYILPTTFVINPQGHIVAKLKSIRNVDTILRYIHV